MSTQQARNQLERESYSLRCEVYQAIKAAKVHLSTRHNDTDDARYWELAAAVCAASAEQLRAEMKLGAFDWTLGRAVKTQESDDLAESWWETYEARRTIEQIMAATLEEKVYTRLAEGIHRESPMGQNTLTTLFKASQLGICADKVGIMAACSKKSEQARFKDELIQFYGAGTPLPNKPEIVTSVHDTATGHKFIKSGVRAAPLFRYELGPDILVSLFGEDIGGELMTARNGLLLLPEVESALEDGAIAIVPDLPDDATTEQIAMWERDQPKNYRWRIIDEDAPSLDQAIIPKSQEVPDNMFVRDLDGRRLSFKNDNRPGARYLYFLFVVAQLKMAWRHEYRTDPSKKLKPQLGKGFWATRGRYLNRALLLALAEEIGHDTSFSENIPPLPGTNRDTQPQEDEEGTAEVGLIAILKIIAAQRRGDEEEEEE